MKIDREQIEKMAQTMCGLCTEDKSCAIRYSTCSEVASQDCSYKESAEELICKGYGKVSEYKAEIEQLKNANSELTDSLVFYKVKSYKLEKNVDKLKTEIKQEVKQVKNDIVKKIEMAQLCGVSMYDVINDLKGGIEDEN